MSKTDWARVDALTDADIEAALQDDPDAVLLEPYALGTFVIYRDTDGLFRWHLSLPNGQLLASSSEGYATIAASKESIALLRAVASAPAVKS
jgi:uncharacterized protein YegP (UPF0339 family)